MAQILPLYRTQPQQRVDRATEARENFDVVSFLDHFLETDDYPEAIVSHFSAGSTALEAQDRPDPRTTRQQLTMQHGKDRLAISFGGSKSP